MGVEVTPCSGIYNDGVKAGATIMKIKYEMFKKTYPK
jgi:hypothetical protein